jgi:uncharacterized protein YgbK (DUF1537 family)
MRLGVIADDLTGAFDTGVQFRNWGISVTVITGINNSNENIPKTDVLVFNTDSRYDKQNVSYDKVKVAATQMLSRGFSRFYKKIDSTLRGNIGAEIDAVMDATGISRAYVAPAYPAYNRITIDGIHLIDGTPVNETEYSQDLVMEESHIPSLLESQSKRKIGHIELSIVKAGAKAIQKKLEDLAQNSVQIFVFDANTELDLIEISKASRERCISVGSAGLASELPVGLGIKKIKPILTTSGSTRSLSRLQLKNLTERLGSRIISFEEDKILQGNPIFENEIVRCVQEAIQTLHDGWDVIISSAPYDDSVNNMMLHAKRLGFNEVEVREKIEKALSLVTNKILEETEITDLILIGGSTTFKIFEKRGINEAEIKEEVLPGIPMLGIKDGIRVVTKAGGFGSDDALIHVVKHLRRTCKK